MIAFVPVPSSRSDAGWELINKLTAEGKLTEIEYMGATFLFEKSEIRITFLYQ